MGSFLRLVPPAERQVVRVTADRLFQQASQAVGGIPAADSSSLCRRTSFVIAAIAPEVPLARLAVLVRYGVWSVALDDRLDVPDAGPTLGSLGAAVTAVVTPGGRAGVTDPLLVELGGIVDDLAGYDRTGASVARFRESLQDAVASGIEHALLGRAVAEGARSPPTAEQYLTVAARTANYHSFAYALLAVGGGAWTGPELARITPALGHGAYALRLCNDLRSIARDRSETTLNILGLRTAAGALVTPGYVQDEIERRMRAHDQVLAGLGEQLSQPAGALTRSLRVAVGLYQLSDLRPGAPARAGPRSRPAARRPRLRAASRAAWTTLTGR